MTEGSPSRKRFEQRLRASGLVLLLLYVVPVLLLPAWHLLDDWLARSECFACADAGDATSGPSLDDVSTPEAPCREPGHHHHNHAPHDAAHCVVCSSLSSLLGDQPRAHGSLEVALAVTHSSFSSNTRAPDQVLRPATLPRAPPAF